MGKNTGAKVMTAAITKLRRVPDWPERLEKFLQMNQSRKFQHGVWDCCQMAAQAIEVMCDVEIESYAGRYATRNQALGLIRKVTKQSQVRAIVGHVMRRYGCIERAPNFAQRGDLMLIWRGNTRRHSIGVLDLSGMITVLTDAGMARIPRDRAVSSWSI